MKKVLFHIDERGKWEMVLKNAQNMLTHYEQNTAPCQVEIVANGDAVKDYVSANPELENAMGELTRQSIRFIACNHALEAAGLTSGDIFTFVVVVPVGVVEIADRQLEGYAYIMP